jgi:hypothetical protein
MVLTTQKHKLVLLWKNNICGENQETKNKLHKGFFEQAI